ncbi:hypothetical protein Pth03_15360 [Planotetraspora thailandica]|uniref:DUF4190 domain-containing protein n=1 Tax=Planotetraspora thailandica TaxID=487172 RepID=A0A8J3UX47_9ACTN|nr:hypothetical protein [Planotetraspora thailandica]GII53147.1 hypothetical protein Pth03_15360 [Planotetraspora thailandica]
MTTPVQIQAREAGGRRALGLAVMALVFAFILPAAGLALSVFAFIISVRDLRSLHRGRGKLGLATSAVVVSVVTFLIGAGAVGVQLYFSSEITAFNECHKGAGTVEAQQECADQFKRGFQDKTGIPWPDDVPVMG